MVKSTSTWIQGRSIARNVLAYLDVPTMGQPEAFIHAKDGLFDGIGNFGQGSLPFMQTWMDHYVAWVKKHAIARA